MGVALERAEVLEQLFHVLFLDAAATVFYADVESATTIVLVGHATVTIQLLV